MTTGGGARGVGESAAGKDLTEEARGCWVCAEVGPPASSDPPDGDGPGCCAAAEDAMAMDREGYTVVYSVFVTTEGGSDAESVTPGAGVGRTLLMGEPVELIAG